MFSLFCEAKFWTLKSDIQIRETDFGAFRYYDKKEISSEDAFQEGKRLVTEKRGTTLILKNKRPVKLKDALKDLEHHLLQHKVVYSSWKDDAVLQLMLNTGLIVNIAINLHNGDLIKVTFDKFLVGKLLSENISDVVVLKTHLIVSYNENQLTVVHYLKPCTKLNGQEKLAKMEPRVQHIELVGPAGRRLDRKITCNVQGDMLLTWWHSSRDEAYPWSPHVKDRDRANIHVYSLSGAHLELLGYHRTEFDPICVIFSRLKASSFCLVEQRVSRKGDVTVENSRYEVAKNNLNKVAITSIPLQTQVCCHNFSPCEEKLVLGCIDGSLVLYDEGRGVTRLVKSAFIPSLVSWHNDGALMVVANERGQFQWFDNALSCVRSQLLSEDVTPANLIDLGSYFKSQPTLLNMTWKHKPSAKLYDGGFAPNDNFLLLVFEGGPIGMLNLIGGGGLRSDVQNGGLTADVIMKQYLSWGQTDRAISLLLSQNWNSSGSACLAGLYHIINYVFRHPLTPEREVQLETALGSFHVSLRPLTRATEAEFGDQVHDLTRRFFHHLVRYGLYEKAFRLAIDLRDSDLFMDLHRCAVVVKDQEMAKASLEKLEELRGDSSGSHSSHSCSSSCSCSGCSSSSDLSSDENPSLPPLPHVSSKVKTSKAPPLPDLSRHNKLRESAFFNRSLYGEVFHTIPEERSSDFSSNFETETACTPFNELDVDFHSFGNSQPLPPDFRPPAAQILTPDYPLQSRFSSRYPPFSPNMSVFSPLSPDSTINDIEKLYDLPKAKSTSVDNLDSINQPRRTEPEALKLLKPLETPKVVQKLGSLDNLLNSKPRARFNCTNQLAELNKGLTASTNANQDGSADKALPRPPGKQTSSNLYSAFNSPQSRLSSKTGSSPIKQKVKFSDTVTQIMVPDISKMSVDGQPSQPQYKARKLRSFRMADPTQELPESLPLGLGNDPYLRNLTKHPDHSDHPEEDEGNGPIKVIHFGVV